LVRGRLRVRLASLHGVILWSGEPATLLRHRRSECPDPRTLAIHWKVPYADVRFTTGTNTEFPALPRHLLGPSFQSDQIEGLINHAWTTTDYVGLGPYRLDRWEPGAFLEAEAFR